MNARRKLILGLTLLLSLCGARILSVGAQEAGAGFLGELTDALARQGWSEEEIDTFSVRAAGLAWDQAAGADPAIAAFALDYYRDSSRTGEPAVDAATLALEVAVASRELSRIGLSPLDVARAAVAGTREALRMAGAPGRAGESPGRSGDAPGRVRSAIARGARGRIRDVPVGREAAGRGARRAGNGPPPHAGPPDDAGRPPHAGPPPQPGPPAP